MVGDCFSESGKCKGVILYFLFFEKLLILIYVKDSVLVIEYGYLGECRDLCWVVFVLCFDIDDRIGWLEVWNVL